MVLQCFREDGQRGKDGGFVEPITTDGCTTCPAGPPGVPGDTGPQGLQKVFSNFLKCQ